MVKFWLENGKEVHIRLSAIVAVKESTNGARRVTQIDTVGGTWYQVTDSVKDVLKYLND